MGKKREDKLSKAYEKYVERLEAFDGINAEARIKKIKKSIEKKLEDLTEIQQRKKLEPDNLAIKRLYENTRKEINILNEAYKKLESPEAVKYLNELLLDYRKKALANLEKYKDGDFASFEHVAKQASKNAPDIYPFYDAIYDTGLNFIFQKDDAQKRAVHMALVPRNISRAKWVFLVALTAHDCKIDLTAKEITLIGRMYNRLADHERGADNDTMPAEYKLRHNPAIHSLHTCTLIDSLLNKAQAQLAASGPLSEKTKEHLSDIRQQLMLMALMHDMGEIEGEISRGSDKQNLPADAAKKFEKDRNDLEEEIFQKNLKGRAKEIFDKPKAKEVVKDFTKHFEASELTQTFMGRFFKACERMQSQHDYLRFNPNGHKSTKLQDTHTGNKAWSLNYVSRVLRDAGYSNRLEGHDSLTKMAGREGGGAELGAIYRAMANAAMEEYNALQPRLLSAMNVKQSKPKS